ncbi:aspartate dehydrogenase [soil metagenome]
MMKTPSKKSVLKLALIGCGAIGSAMLELMRDDTAIEVVSIVLREGSTTASTHAQGLAPGAAIVHAVPWSDVDLVVEAAGHAAIEQHVLPALARGIDCIVTSVGALSTQGVSERLEAAARTGGAQVRLIAGAIGAIDALAAARIGGLEFVRYTGRKPPAAWAGTPAEAHVDLQTLTSEALIFEGTAREAARLYPKNANVAATVSFAGLGLDRTQVRLIADPAVTQNVHLLEARGAFGEIELRMRNEPLASNPKTSALTVFSLVRAIRERIDPIRT